MAVANHFTFGNISTRDYDVVVEGYGNYTAPNRAVEMVSVPGRNGAVIIDQGYYENGEATFKCVIKAKTQHEFQRKVSAFRNAITSQLGYQRLTEGYQADEYRMAAYSGGLDEEPEFIGRAGKFEVNFTCKPQRYLLSGESSISVSSGDSMYNPTPYDASPLLMVQGYGAIGFNGYEIELENAAIGTIELHGALSVTGTRSFSFSNSSYNAGDTITLGASAITARFITVGGIGINTVHSTTDSDVSFSSRGIRTARTQADYKTDVSPITFVAGTSKTVTNRMNGTITLSDSNTGVTITTTITYTANASTNKDRFTLTVSASFDRTIFSGTYQGDFGTVIADSTISLLGDPTYIDCDLGDAYMIRDGEYISLNSYIDLGSDLPTLASGQNEITLDNTITELKIQPRFWIL